MAAARWLCFTFTCAGACTTAGGDDNDAESSEAGTSGRTATSNGASTTDPATPDSATTDPEPSTSGSEPSATATGSSTTAPAEPLPGGLVVDVAWLQMHREAPNLQIIDARPVSGNSHIPGALPLSPIQLATTIDGVMLQILPPASAEPVLQAAGLRNGTTVVVYGEAPEYDPARVVWALHYYGHHDVRYLDGGWPAWVAADAPVDDGPPEGSPSGYSIAGTDDTVRVTGEFVLAELDELGLVDARAADEYDAGHIPSAIHVQWTRTLDADGFLLPANELEALYAELDPAATNVAYCLVGWRASVSWLSLRHLGFDDVRLYDGSWAEWGAGGFPVE